MSHLKSEQLYLFQTNGQCNSFNSIEQLKSRPAHLAAFLHHVISQFDPAPVVRPSSFTRCWNLFIMPGTHYSSLVLFLIRLHLMPSAVLPLCWLLQADQLQRDQTGVHGPPHLLHWSWSSKYSRYKIQWWKTLLDHPCFLQFLIMQSRNSCVYHVTKTKENMNA